MPAQGAGFLEYLVGKFPSGRDDKRCRQTGVAVRKGQDTGNDGDKKSRCFSAFLPLMGRGVFGTLMTRLRSLKS